MHRGAAPRERHRDIPAGRGGPGRHADHRPALGDRQGPDPADALFENGVAPSDCRAALLRLSGRQPGLRVGVPRGARRRAPVMDDLALYRRLARQAAASWRLVTVLFLVSLLASPLALLGPLPLKIAVDSVVGSRPLPGVLDALLPAGAARSTAGLLI